MVISLSNSLFHIFQKEKIAPSITGEGGKLWQGRGRVMSREGRVVSGEGEGCGRRGL